MVDRTKAMIMFDWTQRACSVPKFLRTKIPAMEKATLAACDAKDGLADGLIDRPDKCEFDPKVFTCQGADGPNCLTPKQVAAWQKILNGPVNSAGKRLYVGYSRAMKATTRTTSPASAPCTAIPPAISCTWTASCAGSSSGRNSIRCGDFDYDKDPEALVPFEKDQDADSTDLSGFKAHGGKLNHVQRLGGSFDASAANRAVLQRCPAEEWPEATERIRSLVHDAGAISLQRGARAERVWGLGQKGYKKNDPESDIIGALDRWVDQGIAPAKLIATKFKNDDPRQGVSRTRPVCPYPQVAEYKGSGSVDDAANFVCASSK